MKTNQHCAGGWRWLAVTGAAMIAILILAGCVGVRTGGESAARKNQQTIEKMYRPGDQRLTLPTLRTNSQLGDFLLFAMLNQPQVEAAYYDYQELGQEMAQMSGYVETAGRSWTSTLALCTRAAVSDVGIRWMSWPSCSFPAPRIER